MTMWDAVSDRDYQDWLYLPEPEPEDPDNVAAATPQWKEIADADESCPF